MLAMRAGQGHFLAGLSGHALEFQVKVKAFAALGALQTIHFSLPILRVSGVGCQGRKTKTLKPETSVIVIWNFSSFSALPSTV
jgi:hypothetical protein